MRVRANGYVLWNKTWNVRTVSELVAAVMLALMFSVTSMVGVGVFVGLDIIYEFRSGLRCFLCLKQWDLEWDCVMLSVSHKVGVGVCVNDVVCVFQSEYGRVCGCGLCR